MNNDINILKHLNLFRSFSLNEIEDLFSKEYHRKKNYKKNAVVYFQNEKCNSIDIILKGSITVQGIDSRGNVLTISDFVVGDILGANLLFSNKNFYPMTVLAKTDAIILPLEESFILNLCQCNKDFLYTFLQLVSDKTLILTNKIKAISMKTIRQRIIDFLIYESYAQNSTTVKLALTKKELSEKFGIQRPSLSRELNKMRQDGLIEYDAHTISILDMNVLLHFNEH